MGLTVIVHRRPNQLGVYYANSGWGSTQASGGTSGSGSGTWGGATLPGTVGTTPTRTTGTGTTAGVTGRVSNPVREISLQVKASFYGIGVYLNKESDQIRDLLVSKGWDIVQVTQTSGSGIAGQGERTFLVVAKVRESVTDTQVTTGLRNTLAIIASSPTVNIIRSSATYIDGNAAAGGNPNPTSNAITDALSSLGLGLGLSSPLAIGAVLLGALLIIKKL